MTVKIWSSYACNNRSSDPRIHDIDTPQLVCKPCGGLYEVSTFLPKS